uniref:Uncharacterized protein n=1 Tax=Rhizophora mucronata TaxID=61149 RepID=A0A2P2PN42_RHIMU
MKNLWCKTFSLVLVFLAHVTFQLLWRFLVTFNSVVDFVCADVCFVSASICFMTACDSTYFK